MVKLSEPSLFFKFLGVCFLWASVVFGVLPFEGFFGVVVVAVWVGGGVGVVVDFVETFVDVVAGVVGEVFSYFGDSSSGISGFVVFVLCSGL